MLPSERSLALIRGAWLLILCVILSGCGETSDSTSETDNSRDVAASTQAELAAETTPSVARAESTGGRRPDEVWEDEEGRRYLGNVPYDVFFDNPLEVAGDSRSFDVTLDASSGSTSPVTDPPAASVEPPPASTTGGPAKVSGTPAMTVEVIEAEVKAIRNFLNQKLRSVATYNSSVTMIPPRAATLALLAALAADHSGDISWKDDALYVRDLAARMNESMLRRGAYDQRRLLGLFEDLTDTLNRSRPAGLEEPVEAKLAEVAEMGLLMDRLEAAEQTLRAEISEASFAEEKERVLHESRLLSGLMQAMATESFGYADDPDFLAHAQTVIGGAAEIQAAAEDGNYSAFELSVSKVVGGCQACHRAYRNN